MSAAKKIENMSRTELKTYAIDALGQPKEKVSRMSTIQLTKKVANLQAEMEAAKNKAAQEEKKMKKTVQTTKQATPPVKTKKTVTKGKFVMAVKVVAPETGETKHFMLKYPVINRFTEREGQHEVRQAFMSVEDYNDPSQAVGHTFGKKETAELHAKHYEGDSRFHGLTVMSIEEFLAE